MRRYHFIAQFASPKSLPQKAANEADTKYIERVFRALYGNKKRVKPTKAVDNGVHRSA